MGDRNDGTMVRLAWLAVERSQCYCVPMGTRDGGTIVRILGNPERRNRGWVCKSDFGNVDLINEKVKVVTRSTMSCVGETQKSMTQTLVRWRM